VGGGGWNLTTVREHRKIQIARLSATSSVPGSQHAAPGTQHAVLRTKKYCLVLNAKCPTSNTTFTVILVISGMPQTRISLRSDQYYRQENRTFSIVGIRPHAPARPCSFMMLGACFIRLYVLWRVKTPGDKPQCILLLRNPECCNVPTLLVCIQVLDLRPLPTSHFHIRLSAYPSELP
jgi:hypothetical protein